MTSLRIGVRGAVVVLATTMVVACGMEPGSEMGADASVSELNAAFSQCPYPEADHAPALEFLASPVDWFKLIEAKVDNDDIDSDRPIEVTVVVERDGSTTDEAITLHQSYWPGIEWAMANGGTAWLAIGDPDIYEGENFVLYVVAFTADGRAFFPGTCQALFLYEPLEVEFGGQLEEVIAEMTGVTGPELAARLGLVEVDPTGEPIILLNPEDVPEELLRTLQFALLNISISTAIPGATICTKSTAGWNDCFVADNTAVTSSVLIDAYIADDGALEFWLTDEDANLAAPIAQIGTMSRSIELAASPEIALRIHIDTRDLPAKVDGVDDRVGLLEELPIAELDSRQQEWPALNMTESSEYITPGDE